MRAWSSVMNPLKSLLLGGMFLSMAGFASADRGTDGLEELKLPDYEPVLSRTDDKVVQYLAKQRGVPFDDIVSDYKRSITEEREKKLRAATRFSNSNANVPVRVAATWARDFGLSYIDEAHKIAVVSIQNLKTGESYEQAFYESSGINSKSSGTWFPFDGVVSAGKKLTDDWFAKPYKRPDEVRVPTNWFQQPYMLTLPKAIGNIELNLLSRFHSPELMLVSRMIGGGVWSDDMQRKQLDMILRGYPFEDADQTALSRSLPMRQVAGTEYDHELIAGYIRAANGYKVDLLECLVSVDNTEKLVIPMTWLSWSCKKDAVTVENLKKTHPRILDIYEKTKQRDCVHRQCIDVEHEE